LSVFLALFACDLNDDGNRRGDESSQVAAGSLTPRFYAASGVLSEVDSVHLRLKVVDGAEPTVAPVAVDLPWSAKSATMSGIPLRRKWQLEIYGTRGDDTVWYGTDTGTILEAGTVSRDLSSPSVVVKNFVPRPTILWKGSPLRSGTIVPPGDTVVVQAPDSAHLGIASDGLKPECELAASGTSQFVMRADGSYNLSLVACDEGRWDSRVVEVSWSVRTRDSIALVTRLDSVSGTWKSWTSPVRIAASNDLGVVWRAIAIRDTGVPTVADWKALEGMQASEHVGFYVDSNAVRVLVESSLEANDSVGKILVKARAVRGNLAVDSMRFWWKIHLPAIRGPVVTSERGFGQVRFSWMKMVGRDVRTWVEVDGKWTQVQPINEGATSYTLASGVAPGSLVRFRLVAVDPSSGRASDTVRDSATSRNPPPVPKFTVVNTRTDSAYVTLALGAYTESLEGVEWGVVYGRTYSSTMSFTKVADLATKPWIQQVGQGVFVFAVRAVRDDSTLVDTQWCEVKGLAANRPEMPQNLRLTRRTTDSLYWEWNANPERSYAVHWGNDPAQVVVAANQALLAPGTGRFARKIGSGDSSWIVVFAQPGGDSIGGASLGAFSNMARTRRIPSAVTNFKGFVEFDTSWRAELFTTWTGQPGLRYVVYDSTAVVDTTGVGQESLRWKLADTSRSQCEISIRALNSDSTLSTPVTVSLAVPRIRGFDPKVWSTWVGTRTANLRLEASVANKADSLRLVIPWTLDGSNLDTTVVFPGVGSSLGFAFDSARLRAHPSFELQYRWKNGDRSPLFGIALAFQPPEVGLRFDVGSGVEGDTVIVSSTSLPSGWSLDYRIHSITKGWESRSVAGRYGRGADSIRWRLVRTQASGPGDTTAFATTRIDHRQRIEVVFRDGTRSSIWTTRIAGRTWMAENLAYDIKGDSLDMCFAADSAKCATDGRRYSVSQIFDAQLGSTCDTVDWGGDALPGCQARLPTICPVGWKLPTNADWESLRSGGSGTETPSYRSGKWPAASLDKVDPFGFEATWPTWCYRHGASFGCYDSTLGTAYPSTDPGFPGTIHVAYFDAASSTLFSVALVAYYNATDVPRAPSYFPVRCVKE
jgi:uncharacterized protein (TIGR02145 family)